MVRRLEDRVMDPAYVADLEQRPMEQLQEMRREAQGFENDLSFERRLCQARIDILSAELDHRAGRVEGDVMSRLAQILSDQSTAEQPAPATSLPSRAPDLSAPPSTERPRRRVEEIVGADTLARLTKMPEEEIRSSLDALADYERKLSSKRKTLHEIIDRVQGEIVRRYSSGEEDPSKLLT